MRILVIGAGAIGGIVGAYLTQAGKDVTLCDKNVDHVRAMQEHGLKIDGRPGELIVPVHAETPETVEGKFDVIFVGVKSQHTQDALQTAIAHLADDGVGVSLQNGLRNKHILADRLGHNRAIGAMVRLSAGFTGPGHLTQSSEGLLIVGHVDGSTSPRLEQVAELLNLAAEARTTTNIEGWQWTKEIYNSFLLVSTVAGETKADTYKLPETESLVLGVMREYVRVADAAGVQLEAFDYLDPRGLAGPEPGSLERVKRNIKTIVERYGQTKGGIYRDIVVRKIPIELSHTAGEVARLARIHAVETPLLDALLAMIFEIERGERGMGRANLEEARQYLEVSA